MNVTRDPLSADLLERVAAAAAGAGPVAADVHVTEHRAGGQRVVLEYRFADGTHIFAKRYPRTRRAAATYEILRSLCDAGFGPGSSTGVPEPLGCFPRWGVLLTGAAPGDSLFELLGTPEAWERGLHAAGTWIARLHTAGIDPKRAEAETEAADRIARFASAAAARHPELGAMIGDMVRELSHRATMVERSTARVPTHGRYHLRHVFVTPRRVTAIDLDRCVLGEPAKDLGEFLKNLFTVTKAGGRKADAEAWASVFVRAYVSGTGVFPLGLTYWWSHATVARLLRAVEREPDQWERRVRRYREQLDAIPERVELLSRVS